jgi:hypothetical protein
MRKRGMDFCHSPRLYNQSVAKGIVRRTQPRNRRMGTSNEVFANTNDFVRSFFPNQIINKLTYRYSVIWLSRIIGRLKAMANRP